MVGMVTEEVVVTGENVAQVDTQSSEMAATITGKQVQQLELNGRNFTQLITLSPGVVNQTGQDEGTVGVAGNILYSINGGRTEYNNWEIDGGDNMDNGSNSTLNVYPNLEAIAEFKVLTSTTARSMARTPPGLSKSKPSPAPVPSTAALSTMAATISSTPTPGRTTDKEFRVLLIRSMIGATRSAARIYKRRPSFSGRRNGGGKSSQDRRSHRTCHRTRNAGVISMTFARSTPGPLSIPQPTQTALLSPARRVHRL